MKYEFIKIENTDEGMMAFMLDHDRGVVVIAPVEYLGEAPRTRATVRVPTRRVVEVEEDYIEERPPVRRPVRRVVQEVEEIIEEDDGNGLPVIKKGPVAGEGVDAGGLKNIGSSRPSNRGQSIMPPHLRGLQKKDADFEKRETIG